MKMEATVTKSAVPSMLTVAPMGRTNLEMRGSTLFLSSMQRKVMGSAAALQDDSYGRAGRAEGQKREIRQQITAWIYVETKEKLPSMLVLGPMERCLPSPKKFITVHNNKYM